MQRLISQTLIICLSLNFLSFPGGNLLWAQSYQQGFDAYAKGDVRSAESALERAIGRTSDGPTLVKIHKLLGIVHFIQGSKPKADEHFKKALALDPRTTISADEVLDEAVVPFFNQIKAKATQANGQGQRASQVAAPAPDRTQTRATTILVQTNAKGATILLDGILVGQAGDPIEVDPGLSEITVQAQGFRPRKVKLKVQAATENAVNIELAKNEASPPPKAAAAAGIGGVAMAAAAPPHRQAATRKNKRAPGRSNTEKKELDLFGGGDEDFAAPASAGPRKNMLNEFKSERVVKKAPAPPKQIERPEPSSPRAPANSGLPLSQPTPVAPMAPQQAPMAQPPYVGQPYAQPYPQVYPMPYPMMMPAPMMYPQPYPQPYAQPYPYGPYNQGYPQQGNEGSYGDSLPAPPPDLPPPPDYSVDDPGDSGSRSKKSSFGLSKKPSLFISVLPLGAGQFQNGDYFFGGALAGAQLAALYLWYSSYEKSTEQTKKFTDYSKTNAPKENKERFKGESEKYIEAQNQNGQLAAVAFFGLWISGATLAIVFPPKPEPKSRKRRRSASLNLGLESYGLEWGLDGSFKNIQWRTPPDLGEQKKLSSFELGLSWEL